MNALLQLAKFIPTLSRAKNQSLNDSDRQSETAQLELTAAELQQSNAAPVENSKQIGSPEYISNMMPNVWIYEGDAYDLSNFIKHHPGGEFFIGRMKNRDITTLVNVLHRNPIKVKRRLQKYALGRKATAQDLHPKYNAPPFLFKDDFEAGQDTPHFNFNQPSQLLDRIRARVETPAMKAQVDLMDFKFDATTIILGIAYVLVQILRLWVPALMPIYVFVPLLAILRISLSGAGHYLNHRAQVGWNKVFAHIFDLSYVPMAFVVMDGHTLMHHPYTQSEVDVKRNVFTAMIELPRYYRVPIHTIHKFGHVFTGMFVRTFEICLYAVKYGVQNFYGDWQRGLPHYIGMIGLRVLLCGELLLFWLHGDIGAWLAQFILTVWVSTFMIVASHDFEVNETATHPSADDDWAAFQIQNAYDLTMIGNKYIDCFLSAGLSPHRVHHVLPYQRSGFANIISEDIVREEAEKIGIVWEQPKNFILDRLPLLIQHYLFCPSTTAQVEKLSLVQEHFHPQALRTSVDYIVKGFMGIGSI
jgi:Cytochrome b5-like Heme/Steroid binding domain